MTSKKLSVGEVGEEIYKAIKCTKLSVLPHHGHRELCLCHREDVDVSGGNGQSSGGQVEPETDVPLTSSPTEPRWVWLHEVYCCTPHPTRLP